MDTSAAKTTGRPGVAAIAEPFSSLILLLKAEKEEACRIKVSKVGWWRDVRRWRGSAFPRCWRAVVIITIWSIAVATADLAYGRNLRLTNNVTPLLSVVVGLLLVFRNGAAYGRWDEGRKAFGSMISTVRSLSRLTWINVGAIGAVKSSTSSGVNENQGCSEQEHQAKIKALRMMVAFPVAVKHHVRGEYGTDYEDLRALLPSKFHELAKTTGIVYLPVDRDVVRTPTTPNMPRPVTARPLGNETISIGQEIEQLSRAQSPSAKSSSPFHGQRDADHERTPLLSPAQLNEQAESPSAQVEMQRYLAKPSLPLPLIIAHQLSLYFAMCKKKGLLESIGPAGYNALQASVNTLVDQFTIVERLATVGIPTTYLIHLKQCVSVFLLTLPLVLVDTMGYAMVPFVSICAFTLMGIEGIASEIEMPFGIDIEHMTLRLESSSDEWLV
ncbi:hypothetical protein OIO90_004796 [Microbotryomycetes sp. JL221]|nr:hypothetical protein OIO90_004796 [Microbotryomycetes sp. JL221]